MINLPIFERLEVLRYGLYPGTNNIGGLQFDVRSGLTLVLGANGLGKSTLVQILYRLLTGPSDIAGLASNRGELGNIDLDATSLSTPKRRLFADRVHDGAVDGEARLLLRFGDNQVVIARRLSNLALTEFSINGQRQKLDEAGCFQAEIAALAGVWAFGDWILLLNLLVFSFDQRRALVWDVTAQRQLLRLLFLPKNIARAWAEAERSILTLDSYARNLSAVVFRQQANLEENLAKLETGQDVRAQLQLLEKLQAVDYEKRESLFEREAANEADRDGARLKVLNAEQVRDTNYRELERSRLISIGEHFPASSQSARYVLAQLVTSSNCLACGNIVPEVSRLLSSRVEQQHCVVCDSDLSTLAHDARQPRRLSTKRYDSLVSRVTEADEILRNARLALTEAEEAFARITSDVAMLTAAISERSRRIDQLVRMLPPEETEIHERRTELSTMKNTLEKARRDLQVLRKRFSTFIHEQNTTLAMYSEKVKTAFGRYAEGFLFEKCRILWSPQPHRLGQGGEAIDFPAFTIEMTSAAFTSLVRRKGADEVSESQREFIDLAFRMALMAVAGTNGAGSLVIDAPESSLDGVFASRAAAVLNRFARTGRHNRLLVTSNLVDGDLIPNLIGSSADTDKKATQVVDLFEIAEPNAAVRDNLADYLKLKKRLYRRAKALA